MAIGRGTLALVLTGALVACSRPAPVPSAARPPASGIPYTWNLPPGLPLPSVPADNPMTLAKVELGRRLFYDTRLSGNGTFACVNCHQQARAFTDGLAQAVGSTGGRHPRSAMSLTNVAYNVSFGWADATDRTLETQMAIPMLNEHPVELGLKGRETETVARFSARAQDVDWFRAAFPHDAEAVTFANIIKAIAAFERTLVSGDSPLDRYLYRDDRAALTPSALRGMNVFFSPKLGCTQCHNGFNLSGAVTFVEAPEPLLVFHNNGLYNVDGRGSYPATDRGLIDVTKRSSDMGRFRAPTLRNIAVTAPYMHDGSLATLEAVIDHYSTGGVTSPMKSDRVKPFTISGAERGDVVEFLKSLTDDVFLTNPAFQNPN